MTYAIIEPTIRDWAAAHDLQVCDEFGGVPRRFCYVSGGPHECFQVSVEPPQQGAVLVNVWSVETDDDADLHEVWSVQVGDLRLALEAALRQIEAWRSRPRSAACS
jgi:hypothetical protein